jgi:hypothetical protein
MPDWESGPRERCEVVSVAPGAGKRAGVAADDLGFGTDGCPRLSEAERRRYRRDIGVGQAQR